MVTFLAPDLPWAASTVLAYGPTVTVLEPEALRQEVARQAGVTARLYEPPVV